MTADPTADPTAETILEIDDQGHVSDVTDAHADDCPYCRCLVGMEHRPGCPEIAKARKRLNLPAGENPPPPPEHLRPDPPPAPPLAAEAEEAAAFDNRIHHLETALASLPHLRRDVDAMLEKAVGQAEVNNLAAHLRDFADSTTNKLAAVEDAISGLKGDIVTSAELIHGNATRLTALAEPLDAVRTSIDRLNGTVDDAHDDHLKDLETYLRGPGGVRDRLVKLERLRGIAPDFAAELVTIGDRLEKIEDALALGATQTVNIDTEAHQRLSKVEAALTVLVGPDGQGGRLDELADTQELGHVRELALTNNAKLEKLMEDLGGP